MNPNMKTDLNSSANLFKKTQTFESRKAGPGTIEKPARDNYMDLDELIARINLAIEERNTDEVVWLNLEIQTRTLIMLRMIDWKMWEIYNKFVRT